MRIYKLEDYNKQTAFNKVSAIRKKSGMLAKAAGAEDMVYISHEAMESHKREKRERFEKQREQNIRDILTRRLVYGMTRGIENNDIEEIRSRFQDNNGIATIAEKTADILMEKLFIISH